MQTTAVKPVRIVNDVHGEFPNETSHLFGEPVPIQSNFPFTVP